MLYLVNCTVTKKYYQIDKPHVQDVNHNVEANDEEEAKQKVENHYDKKDVEFEKTHYVTINYCNEVIK